MARVKLSAPELEGTNEALVSRISALEKMIKTGRITTVPETEQPFNTVGQVYELFGNDIDLFKEIRNDIEIINKNAEMLA